MEKLEHEAGLKREMGFRDKKKEACRITNRNPHILNEIENFLPLLLIYTVIEQNFLSPFMFTEVNKTHMLLLF